MAKQPSTPTLEPERIRVLVIDDEPANTRYINHVLQPEGYGRVDLCNDPCEALSQLPELAPDLVILDLMMPGVDGYEFLQRMRERLPWEVYLPVLVMTGDPSPEAQRRALSLGARDFLNKPVSPAEIRLRVRNLLETRFLHRRLQEYNLLLEDRVSERTRELEATRIEILERLARAAEYRDDDTGQHTQRVGRIAARLARALDEPEERVALVRRAAPLHDIGKIGVPDAILLKPGRLTPAERAVMEEHTTIGAHILSGSRFPLLLLAEEIARVHHERWDGRGYPEGLSGAEIPLSGRLVAVADVFDSLTHERPYKPAWSVRDALTEIRACSGTQFDPEVVEALLRVAPEVSVLENGNRWRSGAAVAVDPEGRPGSVDIGAPVGPGGRRPGDATAGERLEGLIEDRDRLQRKIRELERAVERRDRQIQAMRDGVTA